LLPGHFHLANRIKIFTFADHLNTIFSGMVKSNVPEESISGNMRLVEFQDNPVVLF